MFLYLPFILAFLTVLGIALGWRTFSNTLWLATMAVTLWWFGRYVSVPHWISL
ncbi:hypothetical protein G5B88_22970 [Herbaspirillum seropedicae]|jgi:hypothetical protein|uniref:hypothetical protein n=1 Tax=Herbaspirillum seropedicae TaxID=964 RepID=UPI0002DDBD22|nr:hypothetical protein [Herbaspirillum seropedicae]AON56911.1 hypothetical protein Hsc_4656 [Herbaspirillum seropedicae]MDR6398203.1 hypothetical protein [Herbaspirillum seropedicae]UMU23797.1 hypothetical protein G5B88_22970 [Herbaspirillum seropedicae]